MATMDMAQMDMAPPPRAGRREWLGLAVLCLPTLLTTVDITVLVLALPKVSEDLGAGPIEQLWITDIYGFMIAGFLVTMGSLGDRVGHRLVLFSGAGGFIVASLLAAYSNSTTMLLISRALLGIAAATVMPSVLALISQMFRDPRQMGAAFGIWGSSIMVGVVLGPVVGGLLLNSFWWGSVFMMGLPIMALLLLAGPSLLPDSRNPYGGKLDVPSVAMSLGAILPFIYGLKELAHRGLDPVGIGGVVLGATLAVLFVRRQRELEFPLLDLAMFRNPVVTATVVFGLVIGFIMSGTGLVVTLYMQLVEGISPLKVGLWMLIPSIAMIIGGNAGPAIARTVRPAVVMASGALIAAAGALLLTLVDLTSGFGVLIIGLVILYVGGSPGGSLANFMLMSSAPPEKAGSAGSLSSTAGELGVALGVALSGSVATAVYRTNVVIPPNTPPEIAFPAQDSIAGAIAVAPDLRTAPRFELLNSAWAAFTEAMHTVSLINAVLFVGLAWLLMKTAGHIPAMAAMMPPPDGAMPGGPDGGMPGGPEGAVPGGPEGAVPGGPGPEGDLAEGDLADDAMPGGAADTAPRGRSAKRGAS
ncbi:MAG TPA: MFS transporter [Micromonosporaceae bacterium]